MTYQEKYQDYFLIPLQTDPVHWPVFDPEPSNVSLSLELRLTLSVTDNFLIC